MSEHEHEPERYYPPGYTDEQKAALDRQIEIARRFRTRPITITLTGDEWQTILAAMYRALLGDAKDVARIDAGDLTEEERENDADPLMIMHAMTETYAVRDKLHDLMHSGEEDQASWSADHESED